MRGHGLRNNHLIKTRKITWIMTHKPRSSPFKETAIARLIEKAYSDQAGSCNLQPKIRLQHE